MKTDGAGKGGEESDDGSERSGGERDGESFEEGETTGGVASETEEAAVTLEVSRVVFVSNRARERVLTLRFSPRRVFRSFSFPLSTSPSADAKTNPLVQGLPLPNNPPSSPATVVEPPSLSPIHPRFPQLFPLPLLLPSPSPPSPTTSLHCTQPINIQPQPQPTVLLPPSSHKLPQIFPREEPYIQALSPVVPPSTASPTTTTTLIDFSLPPPTSPIPLHLHPTILPSPPVPRPSRSSTFRAR